MGQIQKTKTKVVIKPIPEPVETIKADICVVGGGCSGVVAAIQAARLGKRVVLADALPVLGGQSTNSMIGLFCGLYSRTDTHFRYTYGVVDDILRDLGADGALYYRDSGVTISVAYDEQAFIRWIDKNILKEGITALTGSCIDSVEMDSPRLRSVTFLSRYGRVRVEAEGFIDATGDAALAYNAGLPCRVSDEGPVYGTQMVVADNVDLSKLPGEEPVKARIREKAAAFGVERHDGLTFFFPQKKRLIINMTHIETPLEPVSASMLGIKGRDNADRAYAFLKTEYPEAFSEATVHAYGQVGIRQTRWIKGKKQLIAQEIRDGVRFDDAIARTTWPIELHDTLETHQWEPFGNEHVHYVPFGAMVPPDADNLVACGRCIDADLIALSSVRVMGPCMAMGMAAAHALDLAGGGSVHDLAIGKLQERVWDNLYREDALRL